LFSGFRQVRIGKTIDADKIDLEIVYKDLRTLGMFPKAVDLVLYLVVAVEENYIKTVYAVLSKINGASPRLQDR